MKTITALANALAVAVMLPLPLLAQQPIGKIVALSGDVNARNEKMYVRVLQADADVFADDTILTHADARVEIRMADGGTVVLESNKKFKLDEYTPAPAAATASVQTAAGGAALSPSAAP